MASLDTISIAILLGSLLVLAGILSSLIALRFGAPLLLVFLLLGMLAGEGGPGGLKFDSVRTAYIVGSIALALILFDGGLRTRLATFRNVLAPATTLATIGVLITTLLTAPVAKLALNISWMQALLVGAVVASTDVWGDVAKEVGGDQVQVTSIIDDPDKDPHEYQASGQNQLAISKAELVIVNGGGYDDFVSSMVASAHTSPVRVNAADTSGYDQHPSDGEFNEHLWYDFPTVDKVAARLAAAYSKAQGLDPKGKDATQALAAYHYTLGKALEAQGKDGGPDFRKAIALRPDYAPAKTAAREAANRGKPVWMLYVAGGALAAALALLGLAVMRRRA